MKLKLLALIFLGVATAAHAQNMLVSGTPLTPINSAALGASLVVKASAGSLATLTVTDTASEYIMIINAATLPADGAVALLFPPIKVTANVTTMITFPNPLRASAGIVVCNSSTGTFTKTIGGNTCIFSAQIQ
jgi:hypothetical protein